MGRTPKYFLYLLSGPYPTEKGPVKIGISKDVEKRIQSLQTGCPFVLRPVHVFNFSSRDIAEYVESAFIEVEYDVRLRGEWFALHPVMSLIRLTTYIEAIFDKHFAGNQEYFLLSMRLSGTDAAKEKLAKWGVAL